MLALYVGPFMIKNSWNQFQTKCLSIRRCFFWDTVPMTLLVNSYSLSPAAALPRFAVTFLLRRFISFFFHTIPLPFSFSLFIFYLFLSLFFLFFLARFCFSCYDYFSRAKELCHKKKARKVTWARIPGPIDTQTHLPSLCWVGLKEKLIGTCEFFVLKQRKKQPLAQNRICNFLSACGCFQRIKCG